MIIDLPGFDFEKPREETGAIELLWNEVRQLLDRKGINRSEYGIGSQHVAGLGELVIQRINDSWLVYTTERGTNFDVAIFSNKFYAVNYFIFRVTGDKETIDWSTI